MPGRTRQTIENTVRGEWGRVLSTLILYLRDFDLAEDALQDALVAALAAWPGGGIPSSPAAWLITTAKRKAIDRLRRKATARESRESLAELHDLQLSEMNEEKMMAEHDIPDERLRLVFTCCHPALHKPARVALTLKAVGGLTTAEIARAFLITEEAMAQRIVRAKRKIKLAHIPYIVPDPDQWPSRLETVLSVIYFIFNEGYSAAGGDRLMRTDLCDEAISLGLALHYLLPGEAEISGLLALMWLHAARQQARCDAAGNLVSLEFQDRSKWDHGQISRATTLLLTTLATGAPGPYQIQAAISAVHGNSPGFATTDWDEIALLYTKLHEFEPTAVVELNGIVALSFAKGPDIGLKALETLGASGKLDAYQPFHAARADLLRRLGKTAPAREAYHKAIALTGNDAQRRFLEQVLAGLAHASPKTAAH